MELFSRVSRYLVWLFILLQFSGCAGASVPASYIHPNFDLSFYKRVAILPLRNLTKVDLAGSRVRELALSEFLLAGMEVLEPGLVDRSLMKMGISPGASLTKEEILKLNKEHNIQGLIVGTVEIYEEHRMGSVVVPEVSVELRMIDVESAITVWSVSVTEGGLGIGTQLLGLPPPTLSEATRTVIRRAVDTLFF